MKQYFALLLVCLLLLSCLGCTGLKENAPAPTADSGEPVADERVDPPASEPQDDGGKPIGGYAAGGYVGPQFIASSLTGESMDEAYVQENRLTMLNFWATWCGPCVSEMPDLAELHKNYADQGFGILGVMIDEDTEAALSLIDRCGITYPIIPVSGDLVTLSAAFIYVPTTVFLDSNGVQVGEIQVGSMDYADWSALVEQLLKGLA